MHPLTALSEYRLAHHRIRRDARRSCVRTFPNLQSLAVIYNFGIRVAFPRLSKEDTLEGGYGTGDRVLHSGTISQASRVGSAGQAG